MATDHNFRIKNGLEVGGQLIVDSNGQLVVSAAGSNLEFPDNTKLFFGTGSDASVFYDGSHLRFNVSSGNFNIQANDFHITDKDNGAARFTVDHDGATSIKYNANEKLATTANGIDVTGRIDLDDSNTRLSKGSGNSLRINTNGGQTEIGPQNTSWSHFSTDRPRFYFNKGITVDGGLIGSYDEDLQIQRAGTTKLTVTSTGVDIAGDLTITGDLNTVNTTTLDVSDKLITAGVGGTAATNSGGGFKISGANAEFLWDNTNTQMTLNKDLKFTDEQKLKFGNSWFKNSGDNNHVHFYSANGLIPHSTTTADNSPLGTSSYRWEAVYAGVGDYSSYVQIGTNSGAAFNGDSSLRIQRAGNAYVNIKTGTSNAGGVLIGDTDDNFMGGFIYYNNTNKLELHANNGVALTIDSDKAATFVSNVSASGYLQAHGVLYTRDNLLVLNNAGDGWNTWATRSSGNYNLNVGSVTSTGFSGPGSSITAINASNISSGTLPVARLSDNIFDSYNRGTIDVAGEDFDDYTTTGVHHVSNWSDENDTVANGPTGSYPWGMLRVTNWMNNAGTGDGYVLQEYFPHNTDTCWTRIMWNSSWGGWRESWGSGSDGSGSGLDADKLDGRDTSDSGGNNKVLITNGSGSTTVSGSLALSADSSQLQLGSGNRAQIFHNSAALYLKSSTGGVLVQGPSLSHYSSDASTLYFSAAAGGLSFGGTQFLTSSRNLTNIGTISSGAITSTGSSSFGNGTTVGSVEIDGSGIGIQEAGLLFQPNSAYRCIHPTSMTSTAHSNDISLGWSNNKWKDIYLAGFVKADSGYQVGTTTVIDSSGNLTNIGTISSGVITATQININSGTTNTTAVFSSSDDKAFIRIKDNDTDTYLISKDNLFSIGSSSSDYNTFGVNINNGNITSSGTIRQTVTNVGISTTYGLYTLEGTDAQMDLVSSSAGTWGSAINLVEGASTSANNNVWSIARNTGNTPGLNFNFGSNNQHDNTNKMLLSSAGNLTIVGQFTASTVNTGQGATEVHLMNQNVRTTDSPTFASLTLTGDLNITGDINSYNVTDLDVTDKTITVASGALTSSAADNAGLVIDGADASILWDHAEDKFQVTHAINFDRDTATTTNANLGIYWSAWDKEGTTDYTDSAWIRHTTNLQGYSTALEIKSNNDANDGIVFTTHSGSYLLHNSNKIFTDAYHPNADKWTTSRTLTLAGDLSGNVTFDGSADFTLTATVANDSHTHAFDNLTAKGSGTGEYSTSGYLTAGRGSGGVSLTHNDGYGNANVTFNHKGGNPEQNGNSGRIVVNTDAAEGNAKMTFELLSSVTSGTAVNTPSAAELTETGFYIPNYLYHLGDTDTYLKFDADRIRLFAGGTVKFDSNTTYLTTVPNHNANLITSGTLNTARLPTDMILTAAAPRYRLNETGVTNTPSWWMISDGGNYSIRLNNTGTYPLQIATNSDNNAVTHIIMGYNTDFNDGIDVTGSATINCGTAIGLKIDHDSFAKGLELHREDSSNAASITFSNNSGESGILYARHSDKRPIWRPGGTTDNHQIFTDNYHPNADKWTTPRTHTVELTGEVTGSAAQTVDGTGNKTWSITTTLNNTALDDQYVDIAGDTMTGTLNMNSNNVQNARLSGSQTYLPGHAYSLTHDGSNVYWHIGSAAGNTNKVLNLRIYNSSNNYSVNQWTVDRLTVAGGVTTTADIIAKNSSNIIIGQYSTTDTGSLILTGSTANKQAELKCTNGNLHIDSESGFTTYLNYYEGSGVAFGNGASGVAAWMGSDGDLWKGSSDNSGSRYFHDGYHPNADKWTTPRTLTLAGDLTGNVSFDGSANFTLTAAVVNDSHTHKKIVEDAVIDFGASKLQWMDQDGTGGTGLDGAAPRNPANGWYHNIITNHGNNNGYYSQISLGINTNDMYFGRVANGTAHTFQRVFMDNYHPNADKWTTGRTHTVELTGEVTGSASQTVDGSGNKTWSITTTLNNTALDDQYVDVTGDTMTGDLAMSGNDITGLGIVSLNQNTVGTTFGDTVSTVPTHMIKQVVGDNDGWRLYGESPSSNDVKMIFEIVDDLEAGDTWIFRNKKTYDNYAAREEFIITGEGTFKSRGNGYVNTSQRVFADNYHPNADKWTNSRTLTLAGDLSGNVSFDGSADFTLTATVANDSHNHNHSDGDFTVNGDLYAADDVYGKSVNNEYSNLYKFGGLFFTWDSDTYGTNADHSIRSTYGNTYGDEITLNSYNHIRFNIDSNSNDATSYFEVGHHTTGTGNILMRLTSPSGNLEVDGNVTAYSSSISDAKYKDNIEPLKGSLDKVLKLQGVEFDWTATSRKGMRDIGFIAQEVEPIVPEVVQEHQNGVGEFSQKEETSKSIAYDKLVPLLVESIKELKAEIDDLKEQLKNK